MEQSFSNEAALLLVSSASVKLLNTVLHEMHQGRARHGGDDRGTGHDGHDGHDRTRAPSEAALAVPPATAPDPYDLPLPQYVTARNFRPHLVVGGALSPPLEPGAGPGLGRGALRPHAEDGWGVLAVAGARFTVVGDCARCAMVDRDPASGAPAPGPLKALASYRRRHADIVFGKYLAVDPATDPAAALGWIEEGAVVRVVKCAE